jgi:hypothetical protein
MLLSRFVGVCAATFGFVSPAFAQATSAPGPTIDQCVGAHEQGQKARFDAHPAAARDEFLTCSNQTCPAEVQVDCLRWLREVEALLGRLEVEAGGAAVSVDGVVKPQGVIWIEAGLHEVQATFPDGRTKLERVRVSAGAFERVVIVPAAPQAPISQPAAPNQSGDEGGSVPILGVSLLAAGGAALVAFGISAGLGASNYDALEASGCAPSCDASAVDEVDTQFLVADVSLGLGIGLAVAGGVALIVELVVLNDSSPTAARFDHGVLRF